MSAVPPGKITGVNPWLNLPSQGNHILWAYFLLKIMSKGCRMPQVFPPRHEHHQVCVEMVVCSLSPRASPSKDWALLISNPSHCWIIAPLYPCVKTLYFSGFPLSWVHPSLPPSPCLCGQESDLTLLNFARLTSQNTLPSSEFIIPGQKGPQCPSKVTPAPGASATNPSSFLMESSFLPCPRATTSLFCCYPLLRIYQVSVRSLSPHRYLINPSQATLWFFGNGISEGLLQFRTL